MKHVTFWRVEAGSVTRFFRSLESAQKLADALNANGVAPVVINTVRLPDDPLTRLTVSA